MTDPTRTPEPQETQHLPRETQHLPHEAQHPPQVQHLPQSKWERAMPTPQDAPRWPPTEPEAARTQPSSPTAPSAPQARPEVTYLPRPTGPNWGLVLMGFALVVVAAGVFANQASGFQVSQLAGTGPGVLVGVGLLFALMGIVGMVGRRRH